MQADMMVEPERTQVKELLRDYVELRSVGRLGEIKAIEQNLAEALQISEQIQKELWLLAVQAGGHNSKNPTAAERNGMLMTSVIALTDIHYTRLHAAVMNRIPLTIWMTLYLMAVLSMVIMGYQAGLTDKRSPVATITLAIAFSAVIILITDLDRPVMSFFEINNQLLIDLNDFMQAEFQPEFLPGD